MSLILGCKISLGMCMIQGPRRGSKLMGSKPFWIIESYLVLVPFSVKIRVSIECPQKLMGSAEPIEPMPATPLEKIP